jgi:hypothetical protein
MKSKAIFLILIGLVLLISTVSAGYTMTALPFGTKTATYTDVNHLDYDLSNGTYAIQMITFFYPQGTTVNYTLHYGTASTVDGYLTYYPIDFMCLLGICPQSRSDIHIGSSGYSYDFLDADNIAGIKRVTLASYGKNETSSGTWQTGFLLSDKNYGTINQQAAFYPVNNIQHNTISRLYFASTKPVTVIINYQERDEVEKAASISLEDAAKQTVEDFLETINNAKDMMWTFGYWLKLIFIDHLVPIFAILLLGSIAYCANTSRDVYSFWNKMIGMIIAAYTISVGIWDTTLGIADKIKNLLIRWL